MGKGAETRQLILDRALNLASESGLDKLTIGSLAGEVGMSKSGLFAHFNSKEALQLAVLDETSHRFIEHVVAPAIREPRGEPRIRALFERWLAWEKRFKGGCPYQTAVSEFEARPGPIRDALGRSQKDWFDTIAHAARIAREEGHFRDDLDPRAFAFELLAFSLGFHRHHQLHGSEEEAEAMARDAFEALITRSKA